MTNSKRSATYRMVSTRSGLSEAVARLKKHGPAALDFETTSLHPSTGVVRLVSLFSPKGGAYLVDFLGIRGGFAATAKLFAGHQWVVFNAGFERRWFQIAGGLAADAIDLLDVGYLRRAVLGGGHFSLKDLLLWDLQRDVSKEEQASDWAAPVLRPAQLDYAMDDAINTWDLWAHWLGKTDAAHVGGFTMLNDMVPAVIEMEESGMLLDQKVHATLVKAWQASRDDRERRVRALVGEDEVANINSDTQWSDYFCARMPDDFLAGWPRTEKTGGLSMKSTHLRMLAGLVTGTPLETFFDALCDYKTIAKYLSSFGDGLIYAASSSSDKRIHARYNIGAAKTCRFSSSGPNLQQTPRDRDLLGVSTSVRRSFIAPLGRRLVSLDYSGIELRVLALLSGDEQLLEDVVEGDVHAEVAAVVAGKVIDKTTPDGKAARQAAKGVSFGIIYGSGAGGLSATMRTTLTKAEGYVDFWAMRYPKAFDYRNQMMEQADKTGYIRCVDGGTIYMGSKRGIEMPKCANYPVQRGALTVMAYAIAQHKCDLDRARRNKKQQLTRMLSTIHDALIDEAATSDAPECLAMMQRAMTRGYLKAFPGAPTQRLVEGGIGKSWGELK